MCVMLLFVKLINVFGGCVVICWVDVCQLLCIHVDKYVLLEYFKD